MLKMIRKPESEAGDGGADLVVPRRPSSSSRAVTLFGFLVVAVIFLGFGMWAAMAPLAQAVSAFATLSVKGERKQIQHFEGGIVGDLHVTEGQTVIKGDLLVSLNPLQASATVARHDGQLDQALARKARLDSELQGERSLILEGRLLLRIGNDPNVFKIIEAEQKHMTARRETIDGTKAILDQRIEQLDNEIKGLEIQRAARVEQLQIFTDEMIGLRELYAKGYYPKAKILAVERAIAELRGAAGNDLALIARAKSARGEAKKQIVSVTQRFREDAVEQLRDLQVEISDLTERLLVAEDVLQRIDIRAPRSGIVQDIQFHTIGGVIKPGEVLMEIAPQDDELVVRAQVLPTNIDSVAVGQRAEVRLTALNARTTPAVYGFVMSVSGDSLTDPRSNAPYFLTRIEIPVEERKKLGASKLTAGMPADVIIKTGERTVLNYMLKPMIDAFARGLNED
jgi:HlyD family type I secretion membrane fusion protein